MSSDTTELLGERLSNAVENDIWLIVGTMLGIYAIFTIFSLLLFPFNQLVGGLANTFQRVTFLAAVYAMLTLALNLHWGYSGLFNIGVAGFMAVGVYAMAMLTGDPAGTPPGLGLPLPIGILGGVLAAALIGAVAAYPALRLRADYLAIVTVALSEIIRLSLLSLELQTFTLFGVRLGTGAGRGIDLPTNPVRGIYYQDPTNTAAGLTPVGDYLFPLADSVGVATSTIVSGTYTLVLVGIMIGFYWLLVRIGNSPFGRILKAIREDEEATQALGKDTRLVKVKVFMVGCALMGLGGILWEGAKGFTDPTATTFLPLQTFYIFIALIIGGAGSNTGSVLGGALFASLLFEAPFFVARTIREYLNLGSAPGTFAGALGELFVLDPFPFLAYTVQNISQLRFVLVGIVLIAVIQHRSEGLLGHRKEEAASVDLHVRDTPLSNGGEKDG